MTETSAEKRQKLIAKVKALLAMTTDRGASEAEAINAAQLASKLMEEHDLTYHDIEAELAEDRFGARGRKFADSNRLHESSNCVNVIAKYWDCVTWWGYNETTKETTLVYFGSADDTALAHEMTSMIRSAMENAWQRYKMSPGRPTHIPGHVLRADFLFGMTVRLCQRLEALKAARSGSGDTSRALVVAKGAIVHERLEIFKAKTGMRIEVEEPEQTISRDVIGEAYFAGKAAGQQVKLADELEEK
jgi:hypothetical protein